MKDDHKMDEQGFPGHMEPLIVRYLSGNAGATEIAELEQWVQSSEDNRRAFIAFKKTWFLAALDKDNKSADLSHEWLSLRESIKEDASIRTLKTSKGDRNWLGWVASLAVLVVFSWWILSRSEAMEQIAAIDHTFEHTMPDGSVISLNQGASIRYFTTMEEDRKVILEGDAFFSVSPDPERPFKIAAENIQIEVLGTSFYVDARQDQPLVQVVVSSGKVSFGKDQDKIVLEPGQTGIYNKTSGQVSQYITTDKNFLSWQSGRLEFEDDMLSDVVFAINRHFHRHLSIGAKILLECRLTATYANQSFDDVLRILEQTFSLRIEENGDQVILRGEGCN